jgi:AraC-like DNA-binding protein
MASCETLGSALGTYVALQMTNSTAAAAYLHPVGDDYALGFGIYAPELPSSHIHDVAAATACNIVHDLTGGAVRPQEVLLSRPVPSDPEVYHRYFRCPVRFNDGQTCLILSARDMAFRLPSANAKLRENLLAALQRQLAQQPQGFAARVKHALRPLLLSGSASHRQVAKHLNTHPRTMGRRLEAEGFTFEQLKDEVRLVVARELLARTDIAISDVAAALGYATPSAFVRAFRRWTGGSPSAWRKEHRTEAV